MTTDAKGNGNEDYRRNALACGFLTAQEAQNSDENAARMAAGSPPIYRVNVTARTAKAINYQQRSGATKIDFRGTELLSQARGEAKVESKQGYIEIEVEFDDLQPANIHGAEYLTYVLWAITPEGRTSNLGEILLNGTKSKLNVTTELQVFGLVVTAEPFNAAAAWTSIRWRSVLSWVSRMYACLATLGTFR